MRRAANKPNKHKGMRFGAVFVALVAGGALAQAPAPVTAPDSSAEKGAKDADKARVEISGKVQADYIFDFKRVDPSWNATLRPSKIPINCPGDAGCGKDGETIFSVKQTLFAVKAFVPTTAGEIKTELSLDLFNAGTTNSFRLLNAWAQLGNWSAGQYYTLFMNIDSFPNTIDYWGPNGMTFIRNPQVRYTMPIGESQKLAVSLESPGSAIDTGKVSVAAPGLGIQGRSHYPDVIGRWSVERESSQLHVAGLLRSIGWETTTTPDFNPSGTKTGYGATVMGFLGVGKGKDRVTGQLVFGKGIASYMNDGGVDIAPNLADRRAEAVKSFGAFAYFDHYWSDKWSSSLGGSVHRQTNIDGQLNNAFHEGRYGSVNLLFYPAKNVLTGGEFLYGRNEQKDGHSATDHRVQFSAQFKF
jgi:hypothetical protein